MYPPLPGLAFPSSVPPPNEMFVPDDGLYYDSLLGIYTTPRGARNMTARRMVGSGKPVLLNLDM